MKNSKAVLALSLSALCALQPVFVCAQEMELDKLVITASRSDTALKDIPSDVSVLQASEIAQDNPLTFDDFLNRALPVPDANLFYPTRGSKERHVNLRGLGGGPFMRTRVLLDGMPLNEPHRNFVDWNLIPMDVLDRAEILEGPSSSLYGSGAVGGVISLVTKTPQKKSETTLKESYRSLGTNIWGASQAGRLGRFSYLASVQDFQTEGYVADQVPASYHSPRSRQSLGTYTKLGYQAGDSVSLGFSFLHGNDEANRGTRLNYVYSNNNLGQVSAEGKHEKLSWASRFRMRLDRFRNVNDKAPTFSYVDTVQDTLTREVGGDGQASYQLLDSAKVTLGLEGARNSTQVDTQYQSAIRQQVTHGAQAYFGAFMQGEFKWLEEKMVANLGGRGDWYRNSEGFFKDTQGSVDTAYEDHSFSAFSPKLGLLYHLTESVALRSTVGKSFRAPPYLFLYGQNFQGGSTVSGNPALSSESLWMYDAGTDIRWSRGGLAKLTFYQGWAKDFVTLRNLNATGTQKTYANASAVRMLGVTAEVNAPIADHWKARTGYAFQYSKVTDNPDSTQIGTFLQDVPRNKFMAGLGYDHPSIASADVLAKYRDTSYADSANALTASAYWNIDVALWKKLGESMTVRLDVENVFNDKYESPGGPVGLTMAPGRLFAGSVQLAF